MKIIFTVEYSTNDETPIKQFYGPPTGCFDLSRLGYTLNGYYLVVTEEYEQWIRKGSYSCSSRRRNSFTMPLVEAQTEAVDLSLMPYREISLDSFQEWKIMNTTKKDGSIQIGLPDTKADLCWNLNSATDDSANNKTATGTAPKTKKATVSMQACEESSEQRFFL